MNDTKQPAPPKSIPVKSLRFVGSLDVPGKAGASSLSAVSQGNSTSYAIEYVPQIRHHRVVVKRHGEPDQVCMIHESMVQSWVPA